MDNIQITLAYNRYNENEDPNSDIAGERYHHTFTISDEVTYYSILEKVEVMLKSLGYEFDGHLEFTGLVESKDIEGDNVIQLHPEE
jgi:hypothetical protein